jgi:general nucleoside transport system ATP-binding protein
VRVLILDEPTKVLTPQEAETLFRSLAELSAQGYGIVLITHKLREVAACADRVVVMRQGRVVGSADARKVSEAELLGMMFGEPLAPRSNPRATAAAGDRRATALALDRVTAAPRDGVTRLSDLSLRLHGGEILGVAGVSGNGQRELADVVLGLVRPSLGKKSLWGEDATGWTVAQVRARGVASIPDDPLALALAPGLTVRENFSLGQGSRYHKSVGLDWPRLLADMTKSAKRLGLPPAPLDVRAFTLSGGNQQRVVLIRELANGPRLIVALYPTRGLDARSADSLRAALLEARVSGAGLLLVSEDLDELFALSDRIIVMRAGRVAGEFRPDSFRADLIGPCMAGAADAA